MRVSLVSILSKEPALAGGIFQGTPRYPATVSSSSNCCFWKSPA